MPEWGGYGGSGSDGSARLIDVDPPKTPEQIRDDGHERPNPGTR